MTQVQNVSQITWEFLFSDLADPRTSEWPLMSNPVPMFSILIFYHYFVLKLGPALMATRKPFQLERILLVYNLAQVMLSTYLFQEGVRWAWFKDYSWLCQPVDFSRSPIAMRIARDCHIYFLAKISELLDTVFFVLRKKEKQITFLHLYHHTVMPIISWGCVKYYPGGHGTFIGFINCFVHIIMYSYYLLAAMGPSVHKYLWWKKYVTTLQLFCVAFLHSSMLLFNDCGYPRFSLVFTLPNSVFFYFLFSDFYGKAYKNDGKNSNALPVVEQTANFVNQDSKNNNESDCKGRARDDLKPLELKKKL